MNLLLIKPCHHKSCTERRVLTHTRVLMWVFPARSVPLPPLWHDWISLRLIIHTVPAACSLWTVWERNKRLWEHAPYFEFYCQLVIWSVHLYNTKKRTGRTGVWNLQCLGFSHETAAARIDSPPLNIHLSGSRLMTPTINTHRETNNLMTCSLQ